MFLSDVILYPLAFELNLKPREGEPDQAWPGDPSEPLGSSPQPPCFFLVLLRALSAWPA